MKTRSLFLAAFLTCGVASGASAMTLAPQKSQGVDVQQAHAVRICEDGRCFWTREHWGYGGRGHWGYGGGWRDRGYRNWDRDWDRDDDWNR